MIRLATVVALIVSAVAGFSRIASADYHEWLTAAETGGSASERFEALLSLASVDRAMKHVDTALARLERAEAQLPGDLRAARAVRFSRLLCYKDKGDEANYGRVFEAIKTDLESDPDPSPAFGFATVLRLAGSGEHETYLRRAFELMEPRLAAGPSQEDLSVALGMARHAPDPSGWVDRLVELASAEPSLEDSYRRLLLHRGTEADLRLIVGTYPQSPEALTACRRLVERDIRNRDYGSAEAGAAWLKANCAGHARAHVDALFLEAYVSRLRGDASASAARLSEAEAAVAKLPSDASAPPGFSNTRELTYGVGLLKAQLAEERGDLAPALGLYQALYRAHPGKRYALARDVRRVEQALKRAGESPK